jgi:hypothetical protein
MALSTLFLAIRSSGFAESMFAGDKKDVFFDGGDHDEAAVGLEREVVGREGV